MSITVATETIKKYTYKDNLPTGDAEVILGYLRTDLREFVSTLSITGTAAREVCYGLEEGMDSLIEILTGLQVIRNEVHNNNFHGQNAAIT